MSRRALLPTPRLAGALVAGAVLIASAVAGPARAQATTPVADNEATVLRIGGSAVSGANSISANRTLTPVRLTTSDPATSVADGTTLHGPVPEVRTSRFVLPAVPAEEVTFRIDGVTVATSVPQMRPAWLQTDAGQVPGALFTAGGTSYLIPRVPITGVTRTVAPSTVNTAPINGLTTYWYGLLPVGAQPRIGTAFRQATSGTTVTGSGTGQHTVYDADAVRGNADAPAEELVLIGRPPTTINTSRLDTPGTEVLATVTLRSGATTTVQGIRYRTERSYGLGETTWVFDRAALAAAGATITDVTGVVSFTATDHDLTWQDLGFDLV
ncbi:hypothetical protein [Aquipuribacter sp. MA13-6]|uniref:hypothetical protein n=1 Tax=unclassified Aquipuribacter TaxID=2635084 RepID=UPI003EE8762D